MAKFNIDIDYKRKEPTEEQKENWLNNPELTDLYIRVGCHSKYEKGVDGQKRRVYSRILRKLENALDTKNYEIELETAEVDFIKSLFKEDVKYPVDIAKYVSELEDAVDALGKK